MLSNTIPLGGITLIERIDKQFAFFSEIFSGMEGRAADFIPRTKLHLYNKLTHSVSVHKIADAYSDEAAALLGMEKIPAERSLYRTLERIGRNLPIIHYKYQQFIQKHNLVDNEQLVDFSSFYFEGDKAELANYGYSRDRRRDKTQMTFGISTGINGIPVALTIQKGNIDDKTHMKEMLKVVKVILPEKSLLIFDAGGNTKEIRKKIREMRYHYLTLRQKKVGTYKKFIAHFGQQHSLGEAVDFTMNDRRYCCVKKRSEDTIYYIFFCTELLKTQLAAKVRKFKRQKEKGNKKLKERKHETLPSDKGWVEMEPNLQETLCDVENPYINGVEGFFILESSIDADPEKILNLYKERDKAEKFIRNLKEGLELRPMRHWSKWSILGMVFICFLANFLINLTLFLSKNPLVKNVKLLKKFLINLSLTVVYPKDRFRFTILSNVSPQVESIFGDFLTKYHDKSLDLRW